MLTMPCNNTKQKIEENELSTEGWIDASEQFFEDQTSSTSQYQSPIVEGWGISQDEMETQKQLMAQFEMAKHTKNPLHQNSSPFQCDADTENDLQQYATQHTTIDIESDDEKECKVQSINEKCKSTTNNYSPSKQSYADSFHSPKKWSQYDNNTLDKQMQKTSTLIEQPSTMNDADIAIHQENLALPQSITDHQSSLHFPSKSHKKLINSTSEHNTTSIDLTSSSPTNLSSTTQTIDTSSTFELLGHSFWLTQSPTGYVIVRAPPQLPPDIDASTAWALLCALRERFPADSHVKIKYDACLNRATEQELELQCSRLKELTDQNKSNEIF